MDDIRWRQLEREILRAAAAHVPGWTDVSDGDPGVTMLELFAFLSEPLLQRVEPSDRARRLAARIAGAHARFAAGASSTAPGPAPSRLRYFEGRLLTADDYRAEQEYFLHKHRRHLQAFHGSGVVSGLRVEESAAGDAVTVSAGLAVDAEGREILLAEDSCVTVGAQDSGVLFVLIEYAERGIDPVPSAPGSAAEPSRTEEGCRVTIEASPSAGSVPIARLTHTGSGWQVDAAYLPPRTR